MEMSLEQRLEEIRAAYGRWNNCDVLRRHEIGELALPLVNRRDNSVTDQPVRQIAQHLNVSEDWVYNCVAVAQRFSRDRLERWLQRGDAERGQPLSWSHFVVVARTGMNGHQRNRWLRHALDEGLRVLQLRNAIRTTEMGAPGAERDDGSSGGMSQPAQGRPVTIHLRISAENKRIIETAAQSLGLSTTEYVEQVMSQQAQQDLDASAADAGHPETDENGVPLAFVRMVRTARSGGESGYRNAGYWLATYIREWHADDEEVGHLRRYMRSGNESGALGWLMQHYENFLAYVPRPRPRRRQLYRGLRQAYVEGALER